MGLIRFGQIFAVGLTLVLTQQNCGKIGNGSGKAQIGIQLPNHVNSKSIAKQRKGIRAALNTSAGTNDIWSSNSEPQSTGELNCFGVVVSEPEKTQTRRCFENETGNSRFFGPQQMGKGLGELIQVTADSGENRRVDIIAWHAKSKAACETLILPNPDDATSAANVNVANLSHPYLIGTTTIANLEPGDAEPITISASFTDAKRLIGCNIFATDGSSALAVEDLNVFVEGLATGNTVTLTNKGESITVGNGTHVFPTQITEGQTFDVKVAQQPAGQGCFVTNGSGTFNGTTLPEPEVHCSSEEFFLGGIITGIENTRNVFGEVGLVLKLESNNGAEIEFTDEIDSDDSGFFDTPLKNGDLFRVSIAQNPTLHTCLINGSEVIEGVIEGNSLQADIVCARNGFFVGGTVEGFDFNLDEGGNPTTNMLICRTRGSNESRPLAVQSNDINNDGDEFHIDIDVESQCFPLISELVEEENFCIGSSCFCEFDEETEEPIGPCEGFQHPDIAFLTSIDDNGDFSFKFPGLMEDGESYNGIDVITTLDQRCTVTNDGHSPSNQQDDRDEGAIIQGSDINNIAIECEPATTTIQVSVSGLSDSSNVNNDVDVEPSPSPSPSQDLPTLFVINTNNTGEALNFTGDGTLSFDPIQFGDFFNIQISAQPEGKVCEIIGSSLGSNDGSPIVSKHANGEEIISFSILCEEATYSIGGTLLGIGNDENFVALTLSYGDDEDTLELVEELLGENGEFTFNDRLLNGVIYSVAVAEQSGVDCRVTDEGPGVVSTEDINDIIIDCRPLTLSGTISGLDGESSINLILGDGIDTFSTTSDTPFSLESVDPPFSPGSSFTILVESPEGFSCDVNSSSNGVFSEGIFNGSFGDSPIDDISITCTPLFTLGGSISPINGDVVNLQANITSFANGDEPFGMADAFLEGVFTFSTIINDSTITQIFSLGDKVAVSIVSSPSNFSCEIDGSVDGVLNIEFGNSSIDNISVTCTEEIIDPE